MTGNSYPKQQYRRHFTHNMQGELAALADWGVVLQFWTNDGFIAESWFTQPSRCSLNAHTTLPCSRRASFTICSAWYFIAENRIKQFVYSISQSATLTALFTKESLFCGLLTSYHLTKESLAIRSVWSADLQPIIEYKQNFSNLSVSRRCRLSFTKESLFIPGIY